MALLQVNDGQLQVLGCQRAVRTVIKQAKGIRGQARRFGFAVDLEARWPSLDADIKRVCNLRDVGVQRAAQIGQTLIIQRLGGEFDALCSRRTDGFTPDWCCSAMWPGFVWLWRA